MRIIPMVAGVGILGTILVTQSGCLLAAAAAGTGATVAYVKGDLEADLDARPEAVVSATKAALQDMGFVVMRSSASSVDGRVFARTAQDKKINVDVESISEGTSRVSIRVETFGNEALSRQILDKIQEKLRIQSAARVP